MPYKCWEEYVRFAHSSIKKFYQSFGASSESYYENLTFFASEVIGEKRNTLLDQNISRDEKIGYLDSMIAKTDFLLSNLFDESLEGLRYLTDNFIINDEDDSEILSAKALNRNIISLKIEFQKNHKKFLGRYQIHSSSRKLGKRTPFRESFEIKKGKDVNLRAVHTRLINEDHPFIDTDTIYDNFEIVFSGAPVVNRVNWKDANALHYFIDCIHGKGIERANEGQWERTSKCFTVNGKEITPNYIKDSKEIASSTTRLLDNAIEPFL
jgi:hypothetical protein